MNRLRRNIRSWIGIYADFDGVLRDEQMVSMWNLEHAPVRKDDTEGNEGLRVADLLDVFRAHNQGIGYGPTSVRATPE